jgi:hypothetical protein
MMSDLGRIVAVYVKVTRLREPYSIRVPALQNYRSEQNESIIHRHVSGVSRLSLKTDLMPDARSLSYLVHEPLAQLHEYSTFLATLVHGLVATLPDLVGVHCNPMDSPEAQRDAPQHSTLVEQLWRSAVHARFGASVRTHPCARA